MSNHPCIIGIDPGHGGRDRGAEGNGIVESNYNLSLARQFQLTLSAIGIAKPVLLRQDDYHMSLDARGTLASQLRCDVVISLHVNAARTRKLRGALAFHMPLDSGGGRTGDAILRAMPPPLLRLGELCREATDLETEDDDWLQRPRAVLCHYEMPAVLVEIGYLTNDTDAETLCSLAARRCIVSALICGVSRYLQTIEVASGTAH